MKEKTFIPFGKTILLYLVVFVVVLFATVFAFIKMDLGTLQKVVLIILNVILLYYLVSPIFFYTIKTNDNELKINSDFGIFKEDKIQNKVSVNFSDIKEYKVILSDRDSEGNQYKGHVPKKKYIEITLNDDAKKRFYVSNMNDKQIKSILDLIKEKTNLEVRTE